MSGLKMLIAGLAVALAVPAAAQKAPPVPMGVNGSVLGTAAEFRVDGPARVCMNQSGFDLAAGEIAYLGYMGIHDARVVIRGRFGDMTLSEGDAWAEPRSAGVPVRVEGLKVSQFGDSYGVYAMSDFYKEDRLLIWVTGLHGGEGDLAVLRRIVPEAKGESCTRRFLYGWFFDEAPSN